jgi:hypothetical protein
MRVQRMLLPGTRAESWTVLGDDGVPVEPVERWLAYLSDVDRSPNTVKAYAHDVKDFLRVPCGAGSGLAGGAAGERWGVRGLACVVAGSSR